MTPTDSSIDVKPSLCEGFGIFARVNFKQGDHILDVLFEREVTTSNPVNFEAGERKDHCSYLDGKMMLVAFPARHMNHSCNPNAFYRYESGIPKAFARQAIEAGEQVTVDYLINNAGGGSRCRLRCSPTSMNTFSFIWRVKTKPTTLNTCWI